MPEGSVEDLPPGVSQGHRPPACAADAEASDSEGPDGLSDVLALEDGGDKDVLPLLSIAHQEPPFESPYQVRELVSQAVAQAVRLETELAEKYARATHRIGELEERTRTLEAERDRLVSELAQYRIVSRWVRRPWWKFW
ncbi:MAG: hypothetical protein VKP62_08095 [Candidatus Sericytochromatia bacterium]|nr:hypothetical protein [Candidatus Sericytochromatia bacterium]